MTYLLLSFSLHIFAASSSQVPGNPWPAMDALSRSLPLATEVGPLKSNRFVGIFYFLWLNNRGGKSPNWDGPYDVSKILAKDPQAAQKPRSPLWGPVGMYHFWGEPLFGYYLSDDPWVLRRHAQLLADAGIDTLIFDTTNAVTYKETYLKLCAIFRQIRQEGGRTPQIIFMVNTQAGKTAESIYKDLYQPGLFQELWFYWQGKPLLICDPKDANETLRGFFTLRKAHWPFQMINTSYAWHWEATYPQPYGFTDNPEKPEQVNVSVAQNLRQSDGQVVNMSTGLARGRSFHNGKMDTDSNAVLYGYNFQEQWLRAFSLDVPFVMVTGWNEWIAGRWGKPDEPIVFVDQYSQEFSRDIEPMRGGHGDNYYWQLISNVRRYKGCSELPKSSPPKTIDLQADFDQWQSVQPDYRDHIGETIPRDFDGSGKTHYENRTGRNDLAAFKVSRDSKHLFFYARARDPFQFGSTNNLFLLIDTDQNTSTGWEGFDFLLCLGNHKPLLKNNLGGWNWQDTVELGSRLSANEMHIAVPREALNIASSKLAFDFKWLDNPQNPGDIMDVYVSGDAAPEGRFKFRFQE